VYPEIDPVAIQLGPISVYWYGLSYAVGIIIGLWYAKRLINKHNLQLTERDLDNFSVSVILGMIFGGRLGYVLLYDFQKYLSNPQDILAIRDGGMSFHGAVIGIAISTLIFSWRNKIRLLLLTDLVTIVAPIGIFLGRIANFINCELYGRQTDFWTGVLFPFDSVPRHPSQLYEAFLEGVVLFFIMVLSSKKVHYEGFSTGVFLVFYSLFRIFCELFREPDAQIGFIIANVSMGQLLSIPLLLIGLMLIIMNKNVNRIKN
jgi:phosphatidylglycerol:prolipoprotein diacylglycerol transferase